MLLIRVNQCHQCLSAVRFWYVLLPFPSRCVSILPLLSEAHALYPLPHPGCPRFGRCADETRPAAGFTATTPAAALQAARNAQDRCLGLLRCCCASRPTHTFR